MTAGVKTVTGDHPSGNGTSVTRIAIPKEHNGVQNGMYQLTQLGMAAWKKVAGSVQPDVRVAYGGGVLEHNEVIRDGLERTMQASFGGQLLMLSLSSSAAAEAAARLAGGWHQGDEADTEWVERVSL